MKPILIVKVKNQEAGDAILAILDKSGANADYHIVTVGAKVEEPEFHLMTTERVVSLPTVQSSFRINDQDVQNILSYASGTPK